MILFKNVRRAFPPDPARTESRDLNHEAKQMRNQIDASECQARPSPTRHQNRRRIAPDRRSAWGLIEAAQAIPDGAVSPLPEVADNLPRIALPSALGLARLRHSRQDQDPSRRPETGRKSALLFGHWA